MTETKPKPPVGTRKLTRFPGICKRCSKWYLAGDTVEYSLSGWVHATVEDCIASLPSNKGLPWATEEERDSQAFYQQLQRLAVIVSKQQWTFAKTMPETPHYWAVRKKWVDGGLDELIQATRTMGQKIKFGNTPYNILNLNEHRYWVGSGRHVPPQGEDLINRAIRLQYEPEPEPWFESHWGWWDEKPERFIIEQLHSLGPNAKRVLDVGGTCMNIAEIVGPHYRAIGTPGDMTRIRTAQKTARTLHTEIENFAPTSPEPFDLAVVGFGAGAQLSERDIKRLTYMTRGKVVIQTHKTVQCAALEWDAESKDIGRLQCKVLEGAWLPLQK